MTNRGRKAKIPIGERPAWTQRLISARNASGLGQEALAEKLKLPQSKLADWEVGKTEPDLADFETLGKFFSIPPEFLAFGVVGQPSKDDELIGPLIDRYSKDEGFVTTFIRTAAMLGDEGVHADLHATMQIAIRLYKKAQASSDQGSIRERIEVAIASERKEFRDAITNALQKRIQP